MDIASIREDYLMASLHESDVDKNPVIQFQQWFEQALQANVHEINAMILGTIDENNKPHSRVVLLKGIEENSFIFFTNYHSHKAENIESNPNISLLFFWHELQRQVRIEGVATKISEQESEIYFASRPRESQIGAWASHQSEKLDNRETLEQRMKELEKQYENKIVLKPSHWGGFAVNPSCIEFWQGRANRLHDRILYNKINESGLWNICRLNP